VVGVRLGRVALVLVAAALAGEASLRLARFGCSRAALGPWSSSPPWARVRTFDATGAPEPIPHGAAAWALAPGEPVVAYRLNGLGLREDRDVAPRPPPGTCRVLAIGDAYTFGYGVRAEDAWPRRLERESGGRLEVLNAGFPNLDVEQQRRRLATLLPRLGPDVVVTTFDWWNVPLERARARPRRWSAAWWIENLDEKATRVGERIALVHEGLRLARRTTRVFPPSGLARELEPLTAPPSLLAERWARTRVALAGMAADAAAAGARFLLVVTPLDVQVDPARNALYRSGRLPYPSHGFVDIDYRAARAMPVALERFADEAGIQLVDLTDAFVSAGGEKNFLRDDYHAGAGGHLLIARAVAEWLVAARACSTAIVTAQEPASGIRTSAR
jgi:lysophospholipase L1-like esterase